MGKWNNRSRFNRRRSPSRWYSERPSSSSSGYGEDDGIPAWEKRFCEVIGSVPWPKVVEATNFKSWYTGNVITWDDSACQETFHNEKKRYWSRVNGFHCDISLPDPDLYVSEVDWDAAVDPELISNLERAYFAPPDDDVKSGLKRGRRDRSWSGCSNLVPIEETRMLKIPWEGSEEVNGWNVAESSRDHPNDRTWAWEAKPSFGNEKGNDAVSGDCLTTEGWKEVEWETEDRGNDRWGQGNDGWEQSKKAKGSESVRAKEDEMLDNPWEAKVSCRKETAEDTTWGGWSGKGWDDDRGWGSDGWEKRDSGNQVMEMKELRSTRCSQDYREPRSYNPWKAGFVPDNKTRREYGANAGGWQTHRANETNRREWDVKRSSDGWGRRDRGRDESCGYNTNYRNSRPIRDDYQNRKVNFSSK
ncbi:hypothetical protein Bca52824_000398 [Brassica carinata]|uniref:Uncharacterized protein n=1 Tax=Brassica carinata TaxID=52824 RepID=A0A8X7WJ67_BRACI|nr:hypothetical protein Bca52824_000398 [Brassica carinata]